MSLAADAVGVSALAAVVSALAFLFGTNVVPLWAWLGCYFILSIASIIAWHSGKWPAGPGENLIFTVCSIVFGAAFFGIDVLVASNSALPLSKAIWTTGPFGIGLTLFICPGLTFPALGGFVRAIFLQRFEKDSA